MFCVPQSLSVWSFFGFLKPYGDSLAPISRNMPRRAVNPTPIVREPPKKRGPKPKPKPDPFASNPGEYVPPSARKKPRQRYSKETIIEVLKFLYFHKILDKIPDATMGERIPRCRTGTVLQKEPELFRPPVGTRYRSPTYDEAAAWFKIPKSTIVTWWNSRQDLIKPRVAPGTEAAAAAAGGQQGELRMVVALQGAPVSTQQSSSEGQTTAPNPSPTQIPLPTLAPAPDPRHFNGQPNPAPAVPNDVVPPSQPPQMMPYNLPDFSQQVPGHMTNLMPMPMPVQAGFNPADTVGAAQQVLDLDEQLQSSIEEQAGTVNQQGVSPDNGEMTSLGEGEGENEDYGKEEEEDDEAEEKDQDMSEESG